MHDCYLDFKRKQFIQCIKIFKTYYRYIHNRPCTSYVVMEVGELNDYCDNHFRTLFKNI